MSDYCPHDVYYKHPCPECEYEERMRFTSTIEQLKEQLKQLDRYFTSANDIPVERAVIKAEDYWKIRNGE